MAAPARNAHRLARSKPKLFDYILVDDTSRFGRNKADCLKSLEILTFWEVHLYFVENGLESAQPWFESAFDDRTKADAQFSVSLAIRSGGAGVGASLQATTRAGPATGT
jgi:hypothetical protein